MEYIPLQVLSFAVALVLGIASVVIGLVSFESITARFCGALSIAIALLSTIAWLALIGSHMFAYAYLITGSPAGIGAVGVLLSFRPKLRRERLFVVVNVAFMVAAVVIACSILAHRQHQYQSGKARTLALFNGRAISPLVRLELEHQQRRVICTEEQALHYLESQMAKNNDWKGQSSYSTTFVFADGAQFTVEGSWGRDGFHVSIEGFDGWPTHGCTFDEPMPNTMVQLLDFLEQPYQVVAGQILTISNDGSRIDYDPTLDLRSERTR